MLKRFVCELLKKIFWLFYQLNERYWIIVISYSNGNHRQLTTTTKLSMKRDWFIKMRSRQKNIFFPHSFYFLSHAKFFLLLTDINIYSTNRTSTHNQLIMMVKVHFILIILLSLRAIPIKVFLNHHRDYKQKRKKITLLNRLSFLLVNHNK